MDQFRDCTLCKVEPKAKAFRCNFCSGKLTGRDRLMHEIYGNRKLRPVGTGLSIFAAGLGQLFRNRWLTGLAFGLMVPLCWGLWFRVHWDSLVAGEFADVWSNSHLFLVGSALFALIVSALDAYYGVSKVEAPCHKACPAGIPIPDYLQLIINEEFDQGYSLIRNRLPLPAVIGRVCPHPCEAVCFRGEDGEPIAINSCKRYLADRARAGGGERSVSVEPPAQDGPRVAIVGSGPSGLSCAHFLSLLGARPTVLDASPVAGGRLADTIPDFRLPRQVLADEITTLGGAGIEIKTGVKVGPGGTPMTEIMEEYDAVYMAIGAPKSIDLGVEGDDAFLDFQDLLSACKTDEPMKLEGRVAVVGGGNAAIDVCRTALRCGAEEVHLLYRRDRSQMPARDDEVESAMREGVHFHYLVNPVRAVMKNGLLKGVVVQSMELAGHDESGRPKPVPVEGSERMLDFATVIPCLGQRVESALFDDPALTGLARDKAGRVVSERETCRTNVKGLYAGGDMVRGPETAVAAIADGRRAAMAIFADLAAGQVKSSRWRNIMKRIPFPGHVETPQEKIREEMRCLPVRLRTDGFNEVEEGFYAGQALRESRRCLQCHRNL